MKKTTNVLAIVILLGITSLFAQETVETEKNDGKLILSVNGFESNEGKAMIALFNSEEGYSETNERFRSIALEIKYLKVEWVIDELPFGEYAIKLYHDENGNNKMDRNMLGIPSEDYAFSNNASGSFGPADYKDAKFDFNKPVQFHEININ